MNKIFRLIWSRVKEAWVIVAEKVKGNGGPAPVTVGVALITASLAVGSGVATALPTGAQIASGTVGINTVGNVMTVTNSANAIINWQNFSIGNNETARFVQPSALSAVLNRVTGGNPSQILGALQSNGKVLLINPSGIIFGAGARVDVNGLIASSLDIANQDFLAGRMKFTAGPTAGKVENQGTITTPTGGSVYLIAPDVQNSGVITAPNGDVLLAAGKEVLLVDSSNPEIAMVVTAPDGQSINLGTIVADAGRVGMYGSVVRNSGRINANSAVSEGGKIFLRATKKIELTDTSLTSADGSKGGTIIAKTEESGQLTGDLVARGTVSAAGEGTKGSGGFVETSAAKLDLNGLKVNTNGGSWLLDPYDFTIAASGGDITGAALSGLLGSNSVTIETTTGTNTATNLYATTVGTGTIAVNDPVSWSSAYGLTLLTDGVINVNNNITNAGAGTITLTSTGAGINVAAAKTVSSLGGIQFSSAGSFTSGAGSTISSGATVVIDTTSGGNITIGGDVTSTSGTVALSAAGAYDITTTGTGLVTATTINLQNLSGSTGAVGASGNEFKTSGNSTINVGYMTATGPSSLYLSHTGNATLSSQLQMNSANAPVSVTASGDLTVTPAISTGTEDLTLQSTGGHLSLGGNLAGANIFLKNGLGNYTLNKTITAIGDVTLYAYGGAFSDAAGAAITAQGLQLSGAGPFTLTTGSYNVQKLAGNVTGNITYTQTSGGLTIDTVGGTTGLTSGGAIDVSTTGGVLGVAGTSLVNAGNAVNLSTNVIAGTLSLASGSTVTAGGGVTLTTNLQGSNIAIGSGSTLTATTGNIVVNNVNVASQIDTAGNYSATAGDITLTSYTPLLLNGGTFTSGATKTITLASTSGGIIQGGGPVTMTPANAILALNPAIGAVINLGNNSNTILPLINSTNSASNIQINSNANGLMIGNITHTGTLSLTTAGPISGTGAITGGVGTTLTAQSAGGLNLTGTNGVRTVGLSNSGTGNIVYSSTVGASNTLALTANNYATGGTVKITEATGNINLAANSTANGFLSLYAPDGSITQTAATSIGALSFQASGASVVLTENNSTGVIAGLVTGGDFSYKSTNGIAVSTVDGVAGITSTVGAAYINLTSGMGISQAAGSPIIASGVNLNLTANGPVNLTEPTNAASGWFSAALTGSGSLNFVNSAGVVLGSISTSNQPISFTTSSGGLTVSNNINAGTGYVALKTPGNISISGGGTPVSVSGQTVKLEASELSMSYGGYGASVDASNISIGTDTFVTSGSVALNATSGISIQTLTSGREIAVGTGATGAGLVLNDLSSALFNTPHLRIGNDNTTGSYGAYSGTIAVGGSGISRPTLQLGLTTAGAISQTAPVAVSSLGLISGSGQNIVLMDSTNSVASLAGKSGGQFSFAGTGSLALASMTGGVPAVTLNGITASGAVTLISYGSITDSVASVPAVVAPSVALSAYSGIGSVSTPLKTQVSSLSATNSMTGDIQVINTGALTTGAVTNTGTTGKVSITTKSPLTIGAPLTAGGDIALTAGASGTGVLTDTLTINAAVTSSGGNIALSAGNGIVENAAVTPGSGKTVVRTASLNPPPACSSGYAWNGTACAPTLSTCTTDPSLPGCSGILPGLATCISAPATPGCSAVLPSIGACTENPTAPGCSTVLPSLVTCTTTPTAPGCSAVLPTIATCTSAPATPGCSAVLPTIVTCTITPTAPGCSAVLPTLATCTSAPATPGCSAVLPTIVTCTTTPTAPGCSAVLPTMATCTSTPATPGCSAVLPTIATCTTNPSAPGCSAVLPTIATCTSVPATPGCSAVLPTIVACTTTPTAPGCSVVLPTMATCTSAPTTPGCSVVLPSIATCTSAPASPGCSVVLPSLITCTTTPSAPGCSVVLPTIAICSSSPATPGCSAVMPSLATCIASPGTIGCGAVLPSMQSCVAAPTTPGCSAVLPTLADCAANPSAPGCVVVVPVVENKELAPKTNQLVNSLNPLPTSPVTPAGLKLIAQAPPAQSTSGGGGGTGDGGNNSEDKDKDKNRNGQGQPPTGGGNTDEKPKKNYCN